MPQGAPSPRSAVLAHGCGPHPAPRPRHRTPARGREAHPQGAPRESRPRIRPPRDPTGLSWSRPPRSPGRGVPPAGRSRSAPTSALAPPNARWPSGALCPHSPELIPPRTRPSSGWARGRRVTKVVAQEVPDRGRVSGTAAGQGSSPLGTSLPYTPFQPLGSCPRRGPHSYAVSRVHTTPASRGLSGDVHPSCTLLLPGPAAEAWAGEGTGPRPGGGSSSGAVSVQEVGPAEALPLSPGWARLPLIHGNAARPTPAPGQACLSPSCFWKARRRTVPQLTQTPLNPGHLLPGPHQAQQSRDSHPVLQVTKQARVRQRWDSNPGPRETTA